jgi:AcrR family transcriptional regulator
VARRPLAHPASPHAAPLRARLRDATRAAILTSAEDVFAEHGPQRARMEQIAARAGVSVGTLYNHFADRAALLSAIYSARRSAYVKAVRDEVRDVEGNLETRLTALAEAIFRGFDAQRPMLRHLLRHDAFGEQSSVFDMAASPPPTLLEFRALALQILRTSRPRPRGIPVTVAASLFMGMVRAVLVADLSRARPARRPTAAEIVRVFLNGALVP